MKKSTPYARKHKAQKISIDEAMRLALQVHQKGDPRSAIAHYNAILEVAPGHADAMHYLAVAFYQTGKPEAAFRLLARVLELSPDYADARNNLGNMHKESGQFPEAEASYRAVIAIRPDFLMAHNNLGVVLKAQGRLAEAVDAYRSALAVSPAFVHGWLNLGNALNAMHDIHAALDAYREALRLSPDNVNAHRNLGRALVAYKRIPEALEVYRHWQSLEPDNPIVAHLITACAGTEAPARASDDFVAQTFDRFANTFDSVLARLEYRAPALCGEMVAQLLGAPAQQLAVLDAGCGTGLCAPLLRPYARELAGVDLSGGMLAKARARGGYDVLEEAELTAWLEGHPAAYDLIVSADTLCYFGALEDVIGATARALRPGAHLVFTVELAPGDGSYALHPHGRYSHTRAYIEAVLAQAGLEVAALGQVALRLEAKEPVEGLLVGARKGG